VARARKRFGQHFLEAAWARKVVEAIAPHPDEAFLEIGPGTGALTRPLAERAAAVVAIEVDRDLVGQLRAAAIAGVQVIEGDFLALSPEKLKEAIGPLVSSARLRVAGNLPYNVASRILFRLVELGQAGMDFPDATLMLQREVAARLLASPGSKAYGVLAILIGHRAKISKLLDLPPGAFRPAPDVHSTLLRFEFHAADPPVTSQEVFAALVQAIFTRRRKTLANALRVFPLSDRLSPRDALRTAAVDPRRRPETLTIAECARLADGFAAHRARSG
jgi:16S rRNA (adenine1518-N6/adenine1519-N6)-dimethyltransferase